LYDWPPAESEAPETRLRTTAPWFNVSIVAIPNSTCHRLDVVAPKDLKYQFLCTGMQKAM